MNNEKRQNASYEKSNSRQSLKIQELEKRILEAENRFDDYLLLAGGELVGNLRIKKGTPTLILEEADASKGAAAVQAGTNDVFLMALDAAESWDNYRRLIVFNKASGIASEKAVQWSECTDGVNTFYNLYGDHNRSLHIHDTELKMHDGVRQRVVLRCLDDGDDNNYGSEVVLGGDGNTYVGSGESPMNLYKANGKSIGETLYLSSDGNIVIAPNCNTITNRKPIWITTASFHPEASGSHTLGNGTYKWGQIYSTNSSISTSDRNRKNSIESLNDKAVQFILSLPTVSYKLNDGTSDRRHWGMIAQDVEQVMDGLAISSRDFAGFIKSPKEKIVDRRTGELALDLDEEGNIQYEYALRYEEFIAPLIKTVQAQQERIRKLERLVGGEADGMEN